MGAVDYFLKIDGVEGESQDSKHKSEIQLESWSWGETQSGSANKGVGLGAGKVVMQDFVFVKNVDKASPKLMLKCATGEHIPNVVLTCRKAGKDQQEFLKVFFKDTLISSCQISGTGNADIIPVENISLNFTAIKVEYREQKPDGTLGGSTVFEYDLKQMVAKF
jgi:type VI secretion system secreted protein Hcp